MAKKRSVKHKKNPYVFLRRDLSIQVKVDMKFN